MAKARKNTMSRKQQFDLFAWLQKHEDEITKNRLTRAVIAARASEALGQDLTESNVLSVMKHAGIVVSRVPSARPGSDRVRRLSYVVRELFSRLGESFPEDLERLCNGLRPSTPSDDSDD